MALYPLKKTSCNTDKYIEILRIVISNCQVYIFFEVIAGDVYQRLARKGLGVNSITSKSQDYLPTS